MSISQINKSQNNYPKSSQFCFSETSGQSWESHTLAPWLPDEAIPR